MNAKHYYGKIALNVALPSSLAKKDIKRRVNTHHGDVKLNINNNIKFSKDIIDATYFSLTLSPLTSYGGISSRNKLNTTYIEIYPHQLSLKYYILPSNSLHHE